MTVVRIRLPSLLTSLLHLPRTIESEGETLDEVLQNLRQSWPALATHLFDESGSFREHVLCFVNETNSRDIEASKYAIRDGDVLTILQAVSGG